MIQHRTGLILIRLRQFPRFSPFHISVDGADELQDFFHSLIHLHSQNEISDSLTHSPAVLGQLQLEFARHCGLRNPTVEIALDQSGDSAHKIPEIVGQIAVVATDKCVHGKIGILSQHHISHKEITDRIDTKFFNQIEGSHHVTQRFRHLKIFTQPPTMSENRFRLGDIGGKKHGGPVDSVRRKNIFPHQMAVRGPPLFKPFLIMYRSHGGHVINESVEPDVGHIITIEGNLDPPRQPRIRP